MPRKRKQEPIEMEPEMLWEDRTMKEADGGYPDALAIMAKDKARRPWCVKTSLIMVHVFGMCQFVLEFFDDGRVVILQYAPSQKDLLLNPDLRFLAIWAYKKGWQKPQPSQFVVRENVEFWKHMWITHQVDSEYLDIRYGTRKELEEVHEEPKSSSSSSEEEER